MFQTAKGVEIPFPEKIDEEFQIFDRTLRLNLSFEKIESMLVEFIDMQQEPLFLVLQLPLTKQEEDRLRKSDANQLHQKSLLS